MCGSFIPNLSEIRQKIWQVRHYVDVSYMKLHTNRSRIRKLRAQAPLRPYVKNECHSAHSHAPQVVDTECHAKGLVIEYTSQTENVVSPQAVLFYFVTNAQQR